MHCATSCVSWMSLASWSFRHALLQKLCGEEQGAQYLPLDSSRPILKRSLYSFDGDDSSSKMLATDSPVGTWRPLRGQRLCRRQPLPPNTPDSHYTIVTSLFVPKVKTLFSSVEIPHRQKIPKVDRLRRSAHLTYFFIFAVFFRCRYCQ